MGVCWNARALTAKPGAAELGKRSPGWHEVALEVISGVADSTSAAWRSSGASSLTQDCHLAGYLALSLEIVCNQERSQNNLIQSELTSLGIQDTHMLPVLRAGLKTDLKAMTHLQYDLLTNSTNMRENNSEKISYIWLSSGNRQLQKHRLIFICFIAWVPACRIALCLIFYPWYTL